MADNNGNTDPGAHVPRLTGVFQVTVVEGSKSQIFYIARNLLDSKAPGFMSAVDPTNHAERTAVELTDVRIGVFCFFVKWLENGHVLSWDYTQWELWLYCCVFGDAYCIFGLRDMVLDHLLEYFWHLRKYSHHSAGATDWITWHLAQYVYRNTPDHSPIRKIIVNIFCFMASPLSPPSSSSNVLKQYPKDFLADVMVQRLGAATFGQYSAQAAGANVDRTSNADEARNKRKRLE